MFTVNAELYYFWKKMFEKNSVIHSSVTKYREKERA